MRSPSAWSYVTFLFVSPLFLGACPSPPTANGTETDATSSPGSETGTASDNCPIGDLGCSCTGGGGCNPGLECSAQDVCVNPDAPTTDATTTTDTTTGTTSQPETDTTQTSTTGPVEPMCSPKDGNPNAECMAIDPLQPYCAANEVCGGCSVLPVDGGCEEVAPGRPICNADDGQCVVCTPDDQSMCGGDTPACDPDDNQCVGCFEHSHCPDTACDILNGKCFDPSYVLYVLNDLPASKNCTVLPGQGSFELPYCNANLAVMQAEQSGSNSWVIKFLKTSYAGSYHGSILFGTIDTPITYALVHEDRDDQEQAFNTYHSRLVAADPVLTIGSNVTVYVDNFALMSSSLQNDAAVGIACGDNANVFLTDSAISDARGAGIFSVGCDVHLRRSMVYNGRTEGIDIADAKLTMVNSYVSNNQYVQSYGGGGIRAENATLDIKYSSILANNNEEGAGADSIDCVGSVAGEIRNSIIGRVPLSNNVSIQCDPKMLTILGSLLDSDLFKTDNNKKDGKGIIEFFWLNKITGAYLFDTQNEAEAFSEVVQNAMWAKGDPRHDFEGDPRDAKVDAKQFPGADAWVEK